MTSLPTLFVPHGAPTFALAPGAAGAAIRRQADQLTRPRAIVIISPHWETRVPVVGTADRLETIHDFWGFPEPLYQMRYPASGCREAAERVIAVIRDAGLPVAQDGQRGLDHGAWVPLRLMYPDADIPVVPLSLPSAGGPAGAYQLGQALAPLVEENFLIIGTGSITHNLRDFQMARQLGGQTPAYIREFADWLAACTEAADLAALLDYRQQAPSAVRAHPTEEHLLPFYVALGAAGPDARATRFHAGLDDYVVAMDAYAFSPV